MPNSAGAPPTDKIGNFKTTTSVGGILHKVSYAALFLLFLAQLAAILHNHSHLGGLSMFDTVMLLIVKIDTVHLHKWLFPGKNVSKSEMAPFLLIVACTVFEALIFVNFTHAVEAITCADSSSHFSAPFLATVALNMLVKSPLIFLSHKMSVPDIPTSRRYFLHFGAPLATVALALANNYFSPETGEVISCLDRYLGAGMCVLLSAVVLPIFKQNMPFLLCEVPKGAKETQLKAEIEQKFPNLRLVHLHIYSKWPGHNFDVFLHVSLVNSVPSLHGESMAPPSTNEQSLRQLMHSLQLLLRGKGARRVTIQPWLAVAGEQPEQHEEDEEKQNGAKRAGKSDGQTKWGEEDEFAMCVSEKCTREAKACCSKVAEMCAGA
ncbi:hypothetical protein niasHS_005684 [Heterodera schachtii]|uniref:Uncharacterized protein n=1 Tax=Heterodera schachtii TaxID=97005 RepID=A0ABD2JZ64_HETSC